MTAVLIIDTELDTRFLEIIAINDHAAQVPASLSPQVSKLPPGSFLLANHSDIAITVIVAVWNYRDINRQARHHRLNCDAYLFAPLDRLIRPQDLSLVNPYGCMKQEFFLRLSSGVILGSPLETLGRQAITVDMDSSIHLTLDSVFFADGQI